MSSNNIGSIYATTISSEKYIVIDSQNIELSGNVIIKTNVTINNGSFNTNSLIPNVNNSASLGTTGSSWSNAYIHDLSVNNNLQVLGNVKINGNLDVSNIYTKNYIDNSFANVYTRSQITASFENVYTLRQIDLSFQNVNISGEIDLSFANVYTRTHVDLSFQNVHTLREIDLSFQNVYIRRAIDLSFENVNISGQIDQSFANVHTRGYIDTSFQNVYIRRAIDLSFANVNISGQIDVSFRNIHTRGYVDTSFQNVYTRGVVDTSFQNVYTRGVIDTSFRTLYTRLHVDNSFANVHTRRDIDLSYTNIYIRRAIDLSFANVNISGQIDQSFANVYTRGQLDLSFRNIYIRSAIDQSFQNVYTRSQADLSFVTKRAFELSYNALVAISGSGSGSGGGSTIVLSSIGGDIIPTLNNTYNLGSTTKFLNNSYINNLRVSNRAYQNINSGPFYEINSTVQTWEWHRTNALGLGKSLATILSAEQNEKVKNLLAGSAAFIGGKRTTNSATAGGKTSADWQWVNGDIWSYTNFAGGEPNTIAQQYIQIYANGTWDDIGVVTMRAVYMSYVEDISWAAVNGYYGLAKDAYPSLNPYSSGVKAVRNWRAATNSIDSNSHFSLCWSPELGIFVAVAHNGTVNRVMYSTNGINWIGVSQGVPSYGWRSVCWSPQLRRFAAISYNGQSMYSSSGTLWVESTQIPGGNGWQNAICWSQELGIFLAVSDGLSMVTTSKDGIIWSNTNLPFTGTWHTVCWSPELKLFVAVAVNGTNRIMISNNGITWSVITVNSTLHSGWTSICWSKELGLFVVVAESGTNRIMTSNNGTTWSAVFIPYDQNWISVCWSSELSMFVAVSHSNGSIMTSTNGLNWNFIIATNAINIRSICWSPELGIFAIVGFRTSSSSLKGCPPTSYNVFDASANVSVTTTVAGTGSTFSFTTVGTSYFNAPTSGNVEVLIVGGGGGGGRSLGGGGGGGGVVYIPSVPVSAGTVYEIVVGDGGASSTNGQNSRAFTATAVGGGAGGEYRDINGRNGGCGGGAGTTESNIIRGGSGHSESSNPNSGRPVGPVNNGGSNINFSLHGFRGGDLTVATGGNWRGAGGGGAGAQGLDTDPRSSTDDGQYGNGSGGVGIRYDILGTSYLWAGGGGGGNWSSARAGWGGLGGGGGGSSSFGAGAPGGGGALNSGNPGGNSVGGSGGPNTGGGGGAGAYQNNGGRGGSGIVVIRYKTTGITANVSSNSIDETGKWTFANAATTGTLTVNTTPYNSDDRLKHNEVLITNGLDVIDKLCPKFYQKTQTLLDASYNGDLSGLTWTYEAGLIAQEVLQVPELSFVVGGGDYYQVNHILRSKLNPPSYPPIYYEQKWNYDLSFAISYYQQKMNTDISFDASYNTLQILSDLRMDASYNILKMNNDLIFDACYNEQKIISDLSSQDLSINDLSYSYYYELSNNVIAQPYTLNYNSIFVYGLAAIKELHAKVKAQDISLLTQQTIINTLTTKMQALETNPNNS
jgi:hypothetical protein